MKEKKQSKKIIRNTLITLILLAFAIAILKYAPNYVRDEVYNKTNLVINYNNVTSKMKGNVYINNGVIYLSKNDIENYYDKYIYYDKQYNQIITGSDSKIATLVVGKNEITVNGEIEEIAATVIKKDNDYYIPISELQDVYNFKVTYINETDTVVIESLEKELKVGYAKNGMSVKYTDTIFSKYVDKLDENEKVVIIPNNNSKIKSGWVKIRTQTGKIGYVKESEIFNVQIEREAAEEKEKIDEKISLVWEYFSEYSKAPNRSGTTYEGVNVVSPSFIYMEDGNLVSNIGSSGEDYIAWAKLNKYKVWALVANNSNSADKKLVFSEIMNDYKKRQELIDDIVDYAQEYEFDGITIDFENMYQADIDMFSRFVIELAPRLNELGVTMSVCVTAPDGSPDWSLCFDRNVIGDVSDYVIFMAYDQNGTSAKEAGTVAGYNWVENNLNKFLNQEEVPSEKIILGIPFYTRIWKEKESGLTSSVVTMKNVDAVLPDNINKTWNDEVKQNYVEYTQDNTTYKMWIEDEESITAKLSLINQYNLAGAGFWVKGFETQNVWNIIKEELQL